MNALTAICVIAMIAAVMYGALHMLIQIFIDKYNKDDEEAESTTL